MELTARLHPLYDTGSEATSVSDVKKAKGMFMMAPGLEDEDFTDSSDEEEGEGEEKTKAVATN